MTETQTTTDVQVPGPDAAPAPAPKAVKTKAPSKASKSAAKNAPATKNADEAKAVNAVKSTAAKSEEAQIRKWLSEGQSIAASTRNSAWTVGDWWAKGEAYSHRSDEAVGLFAGVYTRRTLQQLGYVARNVAPAQRKDELGIMHHQLVAGLPAQEQESWLVAALEQNWSVKELRSQIRTEARGNATLDGDEGLNLTEESGDDEGHDDDGFNADKYIGETKRLLAPKVTSRYNESEKARLAEILNRALTRLGV